MTCMHDNEINNIAECNLLHDIINPTKFTKHLNIHYSTILHVSINTIKVKARFNNFRIIFDIVCNSIDEDLPNKHG